MLYWTPFQWHTQSSKHKVPLWQTHTFALPSNSAAAPAGSKVNLAVFFWRDLFYYGTKSYNFCWMKVCHSEFHILSSFWIAYMLLLTVAKYRDRTALIHESLGIIASEFPHGFQSNKGQKEKHFSRRSSHTTRYSTHNTYLSTTIVSHNLSTSISENHSQLMQAKHSKIQCSRNQWMEVKKGEVISIKSSHLTSQIFWIVLCYKK